MTPVCVTAVSPGKSAGPFQGASSPISTGYIHILLAASTGLFTFRTPAASDSQKFPTRFARVAGFLTAVGVLLLLLNDQQWILFPYTGGKRDGKEALQTSQTSQR